MRAGGGRASPLAGCAADDDGDTLQPLPGRGQHGGADHVAADDGRAPATTSRPSTTGAGADDHDDDRRPTAVATTTTIGAAPVGDWDGARFDAGTIAAVTQLGGADAISFDRYSYTRRGVGTVDAGGMQAEPVAAWWRQSPFSNVRVQLRTFVLAPDVEVLTLDESGRTAACADPPPAHRRRRAGTTPTSRRSRARTSPGRSPR